MILLDLTHTSHTRARTGIQRVCRALRSVLPTCDPVTTVCHDPYLRNWRPLQPWEEENLTSADAVSSRGARWPIHARLAGRGARFLQRRTPTLPVADLLLVPEVFSATVAAALPALAPVVRGPRVAVFHDAIALKFPELSPAKTVSRFPAYLHELARFDGIAAVSEDSRNCLLEFWRWAGLRNTPPVVTHTLGLDPVTEEASPAPTSPDKISVLCVGSIEGRKNHLALLEAAERLWTTGNRFQLRLIGLAHPQTGRVALQKIRELQAKGHPLIYDGPVDDASLKAAYQACTFTVYPSLIEGFGLPVLESLQHGKPCVCAGTGALGESARGGGCLTLERADADGLTSALARLFSQPAERARLAEEARTRTFKSWTDYAKELVAWSRTLPRR